ELQRLPADRSIVLERLERTALQRADVLSFRLDDIEIAEGFGARRASIFKDDLGRPLIVVRAKSPLSWDGIDASLGAICEAIEQPSLESHLRVLVIKLVHDSVQVSDALPDDMDLQGLC